MRFRSSWNDERLDDLRQEMRAGFARVDGELRDINGRLDGLQRTMLQVGGGMIVAMIGLSATTLGVVLTQL